MCTVTININEAQARRFNPALKDMEAITRWAQRVIDDYIASRQHTKEELKPYTIEELNARIDKAERDSAEGRYRDFDEAMDEIEALAREKKLKPYTIEELHARIDKAEREIAAGGGIPHEEVMRRSREKLARKKKELEMADAI